MRKVEEVALFKAIDLLLTVPLPQTGWGMKTASVEGAMQYAADMREAHRLFRAVQDAVVYRDEATALNARLTEFVEWWDARSRADWRSPWATPTEPAALPQKEPHPEGSEP